MSVHNKWESLLSAEELRVYKDYFNQASQTHPNIVTSHESVQFFGRTQLPNEILSNIWKEADDENLGYLTPRTFAVALKLIACAQYNIEVKEPILSTVTPLPIIKSTPQTATTITPAERKKYAGIYIAQNPSANGINATVARDLFLKSRLSTEQLSKIWDLADIRKSGSLNETEFIIAMHYIAKLMDKSITVLPEALPRDIYLAASVDTAYDIVGSPSMRSPSYILNSPLSSERSSKIDTLGNIAFSPKLKSVSSTLWDINPSEKANYDTYFRSIDKTNSGIIQGSDAVRFLNGFNLSKEDLFRIWELVDIGNTGTLNQQEFAAAMHLVQARIKGHAVPDKLPQPLLALANGSVFSPNPSYASPPLLNSESTQSGPEIDLLGESNEELADTTNEVNRLKNQITATTETINGVQLQKQTAGQSLAAIKENKAQSQMDLSKMLSDKDLEIQNLNELREQLQMEQEEWNLVKSKHDHAHQKLEEIHREIDNLKQEQKSNQNENEKLRRAVHNIQMEANRFVKELDQLQSNYKKKQERLAALRQMELEAAQREEEERLKKEEEERLKKEEEERLKKEEEERLKKEEDERLKNEEEEQLKKEEEERLKKEEEAEQLKKEEEEHFKKEEAERLKKEEEERLEKEEKEERLKIKEEEELLKKEEEEHLKNEEEEHFKEEEKERLEKKEEEGEELSKDEEIEDGDAKMKNTQLGKDEEDQSNKKELEKEEIESDIKDNTNEKKKVGSYDHIEALHEKEEIKDEGGQLRKESGSEEYKETAIHHQSTFNETSNKTRKCELVYDVIDNPHAQEIAPENEPTREDINMERSTDTIPGNHMDNLDEQAQGNRTQSIEDTEDFYDAIDESPMPRKIDVNTKADNTVTDVSAATEGNRGLSNMSSFNEENEFVIVHKPSTGSIVTADSSTYRNRHKQVQDKVSTDENQGLMQSNKIQGDNYVPTLGNADTVLSHDESPPLPGIDKQPSNLPSVSTSFDSAFGTKTGSDSEDDHVMIHSLSESDLSEAFIPRSDSNQLPPSGLSSGNKLDSTPNDNQFDDVFTGFGYTTAPNPFNDYQVKKTDSNTQSSNFDLYFSQTVPKSDEEPAMKQEHPNAANSPSVDTSNPFDDLPLQTVTSSYSNKSSSTVDQSKESVSGHNATQNMSLSDSKQSVSDQARQTKSDVKNQGEEIKRQPVNKSKLKESTGKKRTIVSWAKQLGGLSSFDSDKKKEKKKNRMKEDSSSKKEGKVEKNVTDKLAKSNKNDSKYNTHSTKSSSIHEQTKAHDKSRARNTEIATSSTIPPSPPSPMNNNSSGIHYDMDTIQGSHIAELVNMGFNPTAALEALDRYDQDLEKATNYLLDQSYH